MDLPTDCAVAGTSHHSFRRRSEPPESTGQRRETVYARISDEGVEQRFCVLQILCLKTFGKPAINLG
jgi:hypothetical protein